MSKISLRQVYKSFHKDSYVIDHLSLEIFDDEFLVLVGPSGCGKTTTLRMIAGLEELTKGELYIDGSYQNDEDPSTRKLSFVFQNYALLPNLTVYENIEFGLLSHQLRPLEKKKKVEDIANKLTLYDKLGSYPQQLSGGQRQRVALARALIDESSLVLFDEPLSNLDAVLREQMRNELVFLQKAFQMTCIYVTHDQIEAMAMASRIVLLMDGKILQVGTPYQMYHDPAHLDVASFIGSPETNIMHVNIEHDSIKLNHQDIQLDESIHTLIKKNQLKEGYITIRPQELKIHHQQQHDVIPAKLIIVEHFGVNKLLHMEALGQTFRALVDKDFDEQENIFIEFKGNVHVFDKSKNRIFDHVDSKLKIDQMPIKIEDLQVIAELENYGYHITVDSSNPDIKYDQSSQLYQYRKDKKWIQLEEFKQVLSHVSYIKLQQD